MVKYSNLFENVSIGKCKMKNRFAMAPMGPLGLGDSEGGFNQRALIIMSNAQRAEQG